MQTNLSQSSGCVVFCVGALTFPMKNVALNDFCHEESVEAQTVVALSSTAAEYVALSEAMRELLPLRRLLLEISTKLKLPTISQTLVKSTVFEDNQSCLALANAPKLMPGNKYLALRYHFFRSEIGPHKGILVKWVSTENQLGDLFTKALGPAQFKVLRKKLMGW